MRRTPGFMPGVFVCALLFCGALAADCGPTAALQPARVAGVVDGDTLALADGRRVRLIGVNAPETGHRDRPGEPLGAKARAHLTRLMPRGSAIYLQPGRQSQDHYGRILAHAFVHDGGGSVEAALLDAGLAQLVAIPPNTDLAPCLAEAERNARQARRGIWGEPYFAARDARTLRAADAGFRRVRVTIERVQRDRHGWWLETGSPLTLRLDDRDAAAFATRPTQWVGKTVVVRGWIRDRSAGKAVRERGYAPFMLPLQHPAMIESGL